MNYESFRGKDMAEALAQVRASKSPKTGSRLRLADAFEVEVLGRVGEFFHLRFPAGEDLLALLERHGKLPLPPYIQRAAGEADESRYQTVYARERGAIAAPTAGLHFTPDVLAQLRQKGVGVVEITHHVGYATFQPIRVERIEEHRIDAESYEILPAAAAQINQARAAGRRVVAIGTTSVRALESAANPDRTVRAERRQTELYIYPGFQFRAIDGLLTNFHLPKSSLLMLVSAFAGRETVLNAYRHAVASRYRFYSYGDCMLLI